MSFRYIKKIVLENFQDHENSEIELTNGINIIIGSSDAGKSAILRAVNFVFHNNLKGDSFIRHNTHECKVTIQFSDGVEVTRIKGSDVNSYIYIDTEGNKHSYPKVGTSIPEDIKKVLNSPPLDDKKRPISYADQMSNLFLVDLSPTDLPRTLSELTGIHSLQNAAEILSKNARSYDRTIKDKNDKINTLNDKISQYDYVDKDLEKINEIEKSLTVINKTISKTKSARDFIEKNNKIAIEAKSLKQKISVTQKICDLQNELDDITNLNIKYTFAKKSLSNYKLIADEYKNKKLIVENLKQYLKFVNNDSIKKITDLIHNNQIYVNKFSEYEKINLDVDNVVKKINEENKTASEIKKELSKLTNQLKNSDNWCPTCNRPLITK